MAPPKRSLKGSIALIGCLLHIIPVVSSFAVSFHKPQGSSVFLRMADYDYEYLPPNADAPPPHSTHDTCLTSVYPEGTPAGLRGEAVRSALRSTRCIAWNVCSDFEIGWIQVKGKGTMDFLGNKLSQTFDSSTKGIVEACLLTPKGRVVDQISVALVSETKAYMLTSPGHAGSALFDRLDPLIFPMDQVTLDDKSETSTIFSVASISMSHVNDAVQNYMAPLLRDAVVEDLSSFPPESPTQCLHYQLRDGGTLTVLPRTSLPSCACQGYTFVITGKDDTSPLASSIWKSLIGEENPEGPVEIGSLEYETLRIEAGQPAYGKEVTAGLDKEEQNTVVPANPIELHWQKYLDMEKGCYLGQEGIASVLKNPRGPPRTLYAVVFDDEGNVYSHESEGDKGDTPNLTVLPRPGNDLFVLGSNEQISVGTLTSLAEPGATGDPTIVALALVRRADSILKQMKEMDIGMGSPSTALQDDPLWSNDNRNMKAANNDASGIIQPPPMDPLDGLEVIVGGTYTVGTLRAVPSRRFVGGQNMFVQGVPDRTENEMEGSVMGFRNVDVTRTGPVSDKDIIAASSTTLPNSGMAEDVIIPAEVVEHEPDEEEIQQAMEEVTKAQAEAEAAKAEAQRKAEKMEALQRRAKEAMARRKKKKKNP